MKAERSTRDLVEHAHASARAAAGRGDSLALAEVVAELERATDALDSLASRYRLLFDANPEPMWVFDAETLEFLNVNGAAVAEFGYTREEFASMTVVDLRPAEDHDLLRSAVAEIAAGPAVPRVPLGVRRHLRRDGSVFPVEVTAHALEYDGRPAIFALLRDVSASEREVEGLRALVDATRHMMQPDRTLDELIESIPSIALDVIGGDAAAVALLDGDLLRLRSHAGQVTVFEDFPPVRVSELYAETVRTGSTVLVPDLADLPWVSEGPTHLVARGMHSMIGTALYDPEPLGVLIVVTAALDHYGEADRWRLDLLERTLRAALHRLAVDDARRESEERLRAVTAATSDAIYDWDVESRRLWRSGGTLISWGHGRGEADTQLDEWVTRIHPDDRERIGASLEELVAGRADSWEQQYRFRREDGGYAHVLDRAIAVTVNGRRHVVGGMTDVTARVEAERALQRAHGIESVGQLAGGIAHDFNNLLTVVLGNADLLDSALRPERPELAALAGNVRNAAIRGADLVRRLLAFAGREALAPTRTEVGHVIAEMEPLLREALRDDIELVLRFAADLPPVLVDVTQFESAVLNLCINARDAVEATGRVVVETALVQRRLDGVERSFVAVTVADSGAGMSEEVLRRILEPFFTTKAVGRGTGLGVPMVHTFARQSGGDLEIESELGRGSTLRILLPAPEAGPDA
jgi:PAS domain S-box-containing protein